MLEALANAKLRHVREEDIRITQYSAASDTVEEVRGKQEQVAQDCLVDIEKWYPLVVDETFETRFIPVTRSEAAKFVEYFETRETAMLAVDAKQAKLARIVHELGPLQGRIEAGIGAFGGEAFVKTSSRSPKDATELDGRLRRFFDAQQNGENGVTPLPEPPFELSADPEDNNDERARLHDVTNTARHVQHASYLSLRVQSGLECLLLLLNSQRICEDFRERLDYATVFEENIVLRRWITFDWQMELRCFVFENEMRGLSQYTHFMYIPAMYKQRERIQGAIHRFWEEKLKAKLAHLTSYIIDFVITLDAAKEGEDKVYLIELNPFHHDTNGALYRWDADDHELHNGPLKIRVRSDYYKRGLMLFAQRYASFFPNYDETTLFLST